MKRQEALSCFPSESVKNFSPSGEFPLRSPLYNFPRAQRQPGFHFPADKASLKYILEKVKACQPRRPPRPATSLPTPHARLPGLPCAAAGPTARACHLSWKKGPRTYSQVTIMEVGRDHPGSSAWSLNLWTSVPTRDTWRRDPGTEGRPSEGAHEDRA